MGYRGTGTVPPVATTKAHVVHGRYLETKRVVQYQTANAFANEIEIPFIETSAKNSTNISDAFGIMVNAIQAKSNTQFVRNTVQLGRNQVIDNTCC